MKTERISLVPPSMELVVDVCSAVKESEPELSEYLSWVSATLRNPDENMRIAVENFKSFENELRFYILDRSGAHIIGAIGLLIRDNAVPFFEIGYWVRTSESGNGYVTEAVSVIEKYAFSELAANRLEIRAASCNAKSRAVAERGGYLFEAELINERCLPSGQLSNTVVYAKYNL